MVGEISNVVVHYFDLMGKGEVTRLILHYGGQDFKDDRVVYDAATWQETREKMNLPFGLMPLLEFELDGKRHKLSQSRAIETFLASRFDLLPKCELARAVALQYLLGIDDVMLNFKAFWLEQDLEKKAVLIKNAIKDQFHPFAARFNNFIKENGTGFLVGDKLSVADIALYQMLWILSNKFTVSLDAYPEAQKLFQTVENNEKLKSYIDSRPDAPL
uniref:Glutathione transferase n=1 Tax=Rhabditophanes sp. KR3021 TaxID=114890 RepID=A0AC35THJ7_9BILA